MMDYIRWFYEVPAYRGRRVSYNGRIGVITGSRGMYIRIRLDGEKRSYIYHPTYEIDYEPKEEGRR